VTDIRAWIDGGFGDGPERWQELAVEYFSRKKAAHPFAAAALKSVRVELARRLDDVLLARRADGARPLRLVRAERRPGWPRRP
jgi:hypothetical protein